MDEVSLCINLLDELNNMSMRLASLKDEADFNMNISRQAYIKGDFYNASRYAQVARSKYSSAQLNDQNAVKDCDKIIANSNTILKLNATEYYAEALGLYAGGRFNESLAYATRSDEIFVLINDAEGMSKTNALIKNITDIIGPVEKEETPANYTLIPDWVKETVSNVDPVWIAVLALLAVAIIAVASTLVYVVNNARKPRLRFEKYPRYQAKVPAVRDSMSSKVLKKKYRGVGCVLFRCKKKV
ncbi:MAG: hypothetical protein NTU61_00270, partial [Candidatus Altiarchaeota archaeon]|nr:hypothetical protein [Candidatus Altiarchaeota archaeon]